MRLKAVRSGRWRHGSEDVPGSGRRLLLACCAFAPVAAWAQTRGAAPGIRDPNPDASVEIEEVRAGIFIFGGSIGGGRLHFQGKEYSFSVQGLEFGAVGISTIRATGEVFGLRRRDDFPGSYRRDVAPTPPGGEGGPTTIWMRNENGVQMRLRAVRGGGQLRIADAGLTVAFREDTP